jgi:hypothetical protein
VNNLSQFKAVTYNVWFERRFMDIRFEIDIIANQQLTQCWQEPSIVSNSAEYRRRSDLFAGAEQSLILFYSIQCLLLKCHLGSNRALCTAAGATKMGQRQLYW